MNTATAIFLTVVLLVAAFVGVGYLVNENRDQAEEIRELRELLDVCQADNDRLSRDLTDLQQACTVPPAADGDGLLDALPWLMMLVTGGVSGVSRLKARQGGGLPVPDDRLTLRLTRRQMDAFVRWQRGREAED